MKKYQLLANDKRALWIGGSLFFILWMALLLTGKNGFDPITLPLLLLLCYFLPFIGTYFIYVTIDGKDLSVPKAIFFREVIPIKDIAELRLRRHGAGFMLGITVEYVDSGGVLRRARLPSISPFGREQTAEMVGQLINANSSIKIDPSINMAISKTL
jgi:hypothetical protein